MNRLLVASDLSDRSRRAVASAIGLARRFDATLTVLHVADDSLPADLVERECQRGEAILAELVSEVGGSDLTTPPRIVAKAGDPFRAIIDEADQLDAELVVLGAHRKRLLADVFTGTTVERVMRMGGRPVLMANQDADAAYRNILVAVDLSPASARALQATSGLGLFNHATISIVHAFTALGEGLMYYAGVEQAQVREHVSVSAAEARSALRRFLSETGFGDLSTRVFIEKADPLIAIQTAIEKTNANLLVIGTRGHTGMKRVLLGSVADQALRHVECDVLAIPPTGDATA